MVRSRPRRRTAAPSRPRPKRKYETAAVITQIAFELIQPVRSVGVDELMAKFEMESDAERRKIQRYLAGLRVGVFNGVFHPGVLRLEDKHGKEVPADVDDVEKITETRIATVRIENPRGEDGSAIELLPMYLAFTVLRYLEGIVPREQIVDLWRDLMQRLPPEANVLVSNFQHKFYSVPYTPKDYGGCQDLLRDVVDALIRQHTLRIIYYGLGGKGHEHRFEPYTLAMYKGGLYLLGKSDRHPERPAIYLTIERIDQIEKVVDEEGKPARFQVPASYSPEKHFQGLFGIIEGEETEVVLEIQTKETDTRLRERTNHPTQEFLPPLAGTKPDADNYRKARLRMRVRGTTELAMWILGFEPWLKVLEPAELREEVAQKLRDTAKLYETP